MSYRDLRNFTEMMRALGYPRLISMENFRTPNFSLVAEILTWLINRYDPTADLPTDLDTEQDRVIFIKSTAQFLASKAHLKLNTKKLYSADGYAVKELLKVASILYSAMRTNKISKSSSGTSDFTASLELTTKATDLKACRQLASQITARGAKLYELLGKEVELREERKAAISRPVDVEELEVGVKRSISTVHGEIEKVTHMLENLASDEANLELKVEKKKQDLERNQKRLKSLANVRPAFMDEYERLEVELAKQYHIYMEKHCNLSYLEHLLDQHHKVEQGKMEETESSLRQVQMRMAEAEKKMIQDDIISDDMLMVTNGELFRQSDPKVMGSMTGGRLSSVSDDDDTGSLTSDSEDLEIGDRSGIPDEEELGSDDNF